MKHALSCEELFSIQHLAHHEVKHWIIKSLRLQFHLSLCVCACVCLLIWNGFYLGNIKSKQTIFLQEDNYYHNEVLLSSSCRSLNRKNTLFSFLLISNCTQDKQCWIYGMRICWGWSWISNNVHVVSIAWYCTLFIFVWLNPPQYCGCAYSVFTAPRIAVHWNWPLWCTNILRVF